MYSEAISARTMFVIWVRQLLLTSETPAAHYSTLDCCSLSSESDSCSSSFKVGPLFKDVTSKYTWAILIHYSDPEKWISHSVESFGSWITPTPIYLIRISLHPQSNSDTAPREHQASMGLTKCMYLPQVSVVEVFCLLTVNMFLSDIFPFIWISCDGQERYNLLRHCLFRFE